MKHWDHELSTGITIQFRDSVSPPVKQRYWPAEFLGSHSPLRFSGRMKFEAELRLESSSPIFQTRPHLLLLLRTAFQLSSEHLRHSQQGTWSVGPLPLLRDLATQTRATPTLPWPTPSLHSGPPSSAKIIWLLGWSALLPTAFPFLFSSPLLHYCTSSQCQVCFQLSINIKLNKKWSLPTRKSQLIVLLPVLCLEHF